MDRLLKGNVEEIIYGRDNRNNENRLSTDGVRDRNKTKNIMSTKINKF